MTDNQAETLGFYKKLAAAQRAVKTLAKRGTSGKRGGKDVKALTCDDAVLGCRQALLDAGLLFYVASEQVREMVRDPDSADGRPGKTRFEIYRVWVLADLETGYSEERVQCWPVVVDSRMALDHASASASSYSLTYLLRGLLMFERGDEDNVGSSIKEERPTVALRRANLREERKRHRPESLLKPDNGKPSTIIHSTAAKLEAVRDYTAEQLTAAGWESQAPSAEDLEACGAHPIDIGLQTDLYKEVRRLTSSRRASSLFEEIYGAPLAKGQILFGIQARTFAMKALEESKQ